MVDTSVLPGFVAVVLVVCIAPGPDMAMIIATSLSQGSLTGVRTAVGMAIGMTFWSLATALGLAAALQGAPVIFQAIRVVGALYLLSMGAGKLRALHRGAELTPAYNQTEHPVRLGLFTNVTNPKILVFFAAFLPQWVDGSKSSVTTQLLLLSGVFVIAGLIVDCSAALVAGRVRGVLRGRGRTPRALEATAGVTFCVLAAVLLAETAR